jgi:hypothetical protein
MCLIERATRGRNPPDNSAARTPPSSGSVATVIASTVEPSAAAAELVERAFVHVRADPLDNAAAWAFAREVCAAAAHSEPFACDMPPLETVGEFTLPPVGALQRDFQTLHVDFGLPIAGGQAVDVARFTALYVASRPSPTPAFTRVVPLQALLGQRGWPERDALLARFRSNAHSGRDSPSYVEGILARLVEAADGSAALPSPADPGFLCGMEFATLPDEEVFFARHGLKLDRVERRIALGAGELLLFDNLAVAHGRVGTRQPEELHQLCLGYRGLDATRQIAVLHSALGAFGGGDA